MLQKPATISGNTSAGGAEAVSSHLTVEACWCAAALATDCAEPALKAGDAAELTSSAADGRLYRLQPFKAAAPQRSMWLLNGSRRTIVHGR